MFFLEKIKALGSVQAPKDIFNSVYPCIKFVESLKNKIHYQAIQSDMKNVIVLGNIGQGKSTLLNKLAYLLQTNNANVDEKTP